MSPPLKLLLVVLVAVGLVAAPAPYVVVALGFLAAGAALRLRAPTRRYLRRFATTSFLLASFFYAAGGPGPTEVRLGPFGLCGDDFALGLLAAARLVGIFGSFLIGSTFVPTRDLLPYAPSRGLPAYVVGGLLRLAPTLRADAERLRDAQTARGHRFDRRPSAWLPLIIPLFIGTLRRSREQATALHLAGLATDPVRGEAGARAHRWAAIVVLAALAIAGRLALVAWPGVSLSFLVLFMAGVAYGPRVGFLVGALERGATDLALSGLHPVLFIMVPIEALLGALAGLLGILVDLGQRGRPSAVYVAVVAGAAGAGMTLLFSLAADTAGWMVTRAFLPRLDPSAAQAAWAAFVARGLVFNIPSLAFNATLFSITIGPSLRALRNAGVLGRPSRKVTPNRDAQSHSVTID